MVAFKLDHTGATRAAGPPEACSAVTGSAAAPQEVGRLPGHDVDRTVTSQRRPSRAATTTGRRVRPARVPRRFDAQRVGVPQPGGRPHRQLRDLPRGRPRRPAPAARRLDLTDRRGLERGDRAGDVEAPVDVAGGQDEGRRGEAVATQVRALPDVGLPGAQHATDERAAVDGAAAVAPAVRADHQHRVRHGGARERLARSGQVELRPVRRGRRRAAPSLAVVRGRCRRGRRGSGRRWGGGRPGGRAAAASPRP